MFCTKCGCACADNALFCTRCGSRFATAKAVVPAVEISTPKTIDEYFTICCSSNASLRKKIIKVLGIVSLAIQCILSVLGSLGLIITAIAFLNHPILKDSAPYILLPIIFLAAFTIPSFIFTLKGIKKKSTGFLTAALIFAFFSATFGGGFTFDSLALRQLTAIGTAAMYIAIIVLNSQNIKEYKEYLKNNS